MNKQMTQAKMPPVYDKARRLVQQMIASTKKAPRELKYGKVAEAISLGMTVMEHIAIAVRAMNNVDIRLKYIDEARKDMEWLKIKIRVIYDVKALSIKGFALITSYESDIVYQLASWKKSLENKQAEDK